MLDADPGVTPKPPQGDYKTGGFQQTAGLAPKFMAYADSGFAFLWRKAYIGRR